jgi:hypothetical protein
MTGAAAADGMPLTVDSVIVTDLSELSMLPPSGCRACSVVLGLQRPARAAKRMAGRRPAGGSGGAYGELRGRAYRDADREFAHFDFRAGLVRRRRSA